MKQELRKDLLQRQVFGKVAAHVMVIEFQKRGLPHAHILIILENENKILSAQDIDKIISAEIPNPETQPRLFNLVTSHMVHTPCGIGTNRSCMSNNRCSKRFPRPYEDNTVINSNGYPNYRRRDPNNGGYSFKSKRNQIITNEFIVPYNPCLILKYECHINVEVCCSIISVKYLYKYVYKGSDRATMEIQLNNERKRNNQDEIQRYLDGRYISAPEATWRIFAFPLHWRAPNVISLGLFKFFFRHITFIF